MNHNFRDITNRIPEPPKWYDSNGTPRYGSFHPDMCPDIYTHEVVLIRISCQSCGAEFDVEMHSTFWNKFHPQKLHYGDPPIHGCAGDTMNCEDHQILECWHRDPLGDWARVPEHEGVMT